jgi:hypothetical protein
MIVRGLRANSSSSAMTALTSADEANPPP